MPPVDQPVPVGGFCDPRFGRVRESFLRNFADKDEVGASVAVTLDGEYVVDLWGGHKDAERTNPWQEDTIVNVFSTTKTMAAMCLLMLADRNELDLHAPVARYWPEFAANGKENVEVRHFLSHSSGLAGADTLIAGDDLYDHAKVVDISAKQAPWWEPGTRSGYHIVNQGYLLDEVVRRVTGRTLGAYFRDEIAGPLDADFHIGTGPELTPRIGPLITPDIAPSNGSKSDSISARAFRSPRVTARMANTAAWRQAELPAVNGHGNARSVARIQSVIANEGEAFGVRLLSKAGAGRVFEEQTSGNDMVLGVPLTFGMGYAITNATLPIGPNPRAAFWGGWGGSLVVIDQDARLCVAYTMNRMAPDLIGDTRGFSLLHAVFSSL